MSEEAERRFQEQQNQSQEGTAVHTAQPEATTCSTFVNLNFETEGDRPLVVESKQDITPVSAQNENVALEFFGQHPMVSGCHWNGLLVMQQGFSGLPSPLRS